MTHIRPPLLLTRPLDASRSLAVRYGDQARVVISPAYSIVPLPFTDPTEELLGGPILATSAHAFASVPAPTGARPIAYCVGATTAQAAADWGADAQFFGTDVKDMARHVATLSQRRFVYLRGRHISANLALDLAAQGKDVHEVITYEQQTNPFSKEALEMLEGDEPAIVPLFSPRAAEHLLSLGVDLGRHYVLALSDRIADCVVLNGGSQIRVARSPTLGAMCDLIDMTLALRSKGTVPLGHEYE